MKPERAPQMQQCRGNESILFWVGGFRMAIPAAALQAIRKDRGLAPAEIGCKAIVSAHEIFGIPPGPGARLLVLRPGLLAVRVDRVERMVVTSTMQPLPMAFKGAERDWYSGLTLAEGTVIPVVNPETLERLGDGQEEDNLDATWALFNLPQETVSA